MWLGWVFPKFPTRNQSRTVNQEYMTHDQFSHIRVVSSDFG